MMRSSHLFAALVFAAALGFGLGNCGGSSGGGGPTACPSGSTANCTQAELSQYTSCIESKCGSSLQTCFGAGYQSGNYGGVCGATYETCVQKCGCNNSPCVVACGAPSADCQSCLLDVGTCIGGASCEQPACAGTSAGTGGAVGGGAGGHVGGIGGFVGSLGGFLGGLGGITGTSGTCADLMTCCNAIADAQTKSACLTEYGQILPSGDSACGILVAAFRANALCP